VQDEQVSRRQPETGPKHIVIVRHAKSSWGDPSIADRDRPLAKRGRKALPKLREHLAGLGVRVDLVICSPSRRTRETLDGIRDAFGPSAAVEFDDTVYEADVDELMEVLAAIDEGLDTVVLIGHNPGAADLVDFLAADPASGGAAVDRFPTAAVAVLSTTARWSDLQRGCASLESVWTPREEG
jgi:phosphohistidine phosphatase